MRQIGFTKKLKFKNRSRSFIILFYSRPLFYIVSQKPQKRRRAAMPSIGMDVSRLIDDFPRGGKEKLKRIKYSL